MNTSLFSRIMSDNDADAALLDAWLAEREADLALREVQDAELAFTVDADRLAAAAAPFDGNVEPGQIRILSPEFVFGDGAIPYVAVLDRWMEDMWLVAPYSPYSYPASEGEMATGDRLVGRRVLQCWNARTAHESLVSQSYVAGSLDESVRKNALALFRHVTAGTTLPESFAALVGPPVLSKADPRREFLAESTVRYAPLTDAARETEAALARAERVAAFKAAVAERLTEFKTRIAERLDAVRDRFEEFIRIPAYGTPACALAAGEARKDSTETFLAKTLDVEIDVDHAPAEGKVRLVVCRNGERDPRAMEGFVVATKTGDPVGLFENGVCAVDADAIADGFLILAADSLEPIALEPIAR